MKSILIALFLAALVYANPLYIAGQVTDASTKTPLAGANVSILGTNKGSASDFHGEFKIKNLQADDYTLKISYMGYEPRIVQVKLAAHSPYIQVKLIESFFETDQIVVTATRTKKTMEDVPVVTQIINEAEIRTTGAQNLADVLENHPGLVLEKDMAGGENIRMCGIDGRFILVLVDGVPLAGKFNNRQQLDLINANQIDHIEIVKGPGSSLYGSEAMGGVINVITKDNHVPLNVETIAKTGSFGLYDAYAIVSGSTGELTYSTSAEYSTGGIDPNMTALNLADVTSTFANAKLSYADKQIGRLSSGLNINVDEQLGGNIIYKTDTDVKRYDGYVTWNKNFSKNLVFDTKIFSSINNRTYAEFVRNSGRVFRIDSTREEIIGVKSLLSYQLCPFSRIDVGYDYSFDEYKAERVSHHKVDRVQHGVFINSETNYKKLTLLLGGRVDSFSEIGTHYSPRLSAMYTLSPQLKIRSTIGTGFRAPSFNDMYLDYDNTSVGYRVEGNPELKPETSIGSNIGFEYFWDYKLLFNVTLYHNQFSELIIDYTLRPGVLSYKNIENADFTTLELDSKILLTDSWTAQVNYNYTYIGDAETRKDISNVSPHSLTLNFGYTLKYFKFSLKDRWFSQRQVRFYDAPTGQFLDEMRTQDSYNLLETSFQWNAFRFFVEKIYDKKCTRDLLNFRCGVLNILDYTDMEYGPWFGRRFFVNIEAKF